MAAELYDEILFNGATFGDLDRGKDPLIIASATDISTGSRFVINQRVFDIVCSDLNAVPLSRAAAASSAVPVVLSPVTIRRIGQCRRVLRAFVVNPLLRLSRSLGAKMGIAALCPSYKIWSSQPIVSTVVCLAHRILQDQPHQGAGQGFWGHRCEPAAQAGIRRLAAA